MSSAGVEVALADSDEDDDEETEGLLSASVIGGAEGAFEVVVEVACGTDGVGVGIGCCVVGLPWEAIPPF